MKKAQGSYQPVHNPSWTYLGGEAIALTASTTRVPPSEAVIFSIRAAGGAVNYAINGAAAATTSPGYVPAGGAAIEGPLSNLTGLALYGASGTTAYLMWYGEG